MTVKRYNVTLPESLMDRLKKIKERDGTSVSHLIRQALTAYLKKPEGSRAK